MPLTIASYVVSNAGPSVNIKMAKKPTKAELDEHQTLAKSEFTFTFWWLAKNIKTGYKANVEFLDWIPNYKAYSACKIKPCLGIGLEAFQLVLEISISD